MTQLADDPEDEHTDASPRVSWVRVLLLVTSLPVTALAAAALTGVGLARHLPGLPAVAGGVALVALPVVGLAALVSGRAGRLGSVGGCGWFWSLAVLLAMPFYFPGERSEATASGLRYLSAPIGEAYRAPILALGEGLVSWLGTEPERIAEAVVLPTADVAPATSRRSEKGEPAPLEGEVVLPYDGDGQIMRIGVFFDGPRYGDEFPLIFDTGATYTTLNHDALALLEIDVPESAPIAVLRTANGEIEAPLVLVDAAWLGDAVVEWVTVAVCDSCAAGEVAGLLGLNVSGQFQVSLDHTDQKIRLSERDGARDRRLDVAQWVTLSSRVRRWRDGRVEVEVTLKNRAHVPIGEAVALVECESARFEVQLEAIPAQGIQSTRMALPRDTDCDDYHLELARAQWQLDRF